MSIAFCITTSKEHEIGKTFAADVESLPMEFAGQEARSHLQRDPTPAVVLAVLGNLNVC
jgi:hypothetical protein